MIKTIYKTTLVLFLSLGIMSCDSDLDQSPHDNLGSDQAYDTPQDFENAIRGTYRVFFSDGYYGGGDSGDLTSLAEVLGDNVIRNLSGRGTKRSLYDYTFNASNGTMSLYTAAYSMIYRANLILYYIEKNDFQGPNREQISAEARALRAIAHFDVVKYYAKIPTQGGELGLGVPYVTEADPKIKPERLDLLDTYAKIIEDLEYAHSNISSNIIDGRLSKQAIALYLSRVHLYLGGAENNTKASKYASEVVVKPTPIESVEDLFVDETKQGLVFYISNIPGADGMDESIGTTWGQGKVDERTSEYNVTKSFYNMFDDKDVRKKAFMRIGKDNGKNPGIFVAKQWGKKDIDNGIVDIKILRAEEAILNKAEAEFKLGNEALALSELNELRKNRYEDFTPGNEAGKDLEDAIKLERRLEFAFEYNRFLDIKRWGDNLKRFNEGYHSDGEGQKPVVSGIENSNVRFVLPYSQESMNRNPNIIQNPGYAQ